MTTMFSPGLDIQSCHHAVSSSCHGGWFPYDFYCSTAKIQCGCNQYTWLMYQHSLRLYTDEMTNILSLYSFSLDCSIEIFPEVRLFNITCHAPFSEAAEMGRG